MDIRKSSRENNWPEQEKRNEVEERIAEDVVPGGQLRALREGKTHSS